MPNNLQKIRESRNLTQEELGKLINKTNVTVSRYEKEDNRLTLPLMRQLCKVLQCSFSDLAMEENDPPSVLLENTAKISLEAAVEFIMANKLFSHPEKVATTLHRMHKWFYERYKKDKIAPNKQEMLIWLQGSLNAPKDR